jgi:hypothetical protein
MFTYVATSAETAGNIINVANSGTADQYIVIVEIYDAGTFNTTTRLLNKTVTKSAAAVGTITSGAFTAGAANGLISFVALTPFDALSSPAPTGWQQQENLDVGAIAGYLATRNALTTTSEAVTATSFPRSTGTGPFIAVTAVVNPA